MIKVKINISYIVCTSILLIIFGVLTIVIYKNNTNPCDKSYRWLNDDILCKESAIISKSNYIDFVSKLKKDIENWRQNDDVTEVGIFFRDLENGPTFGIDEKELFIPASLLKLPIMFTYFKLAEDYPNILNTRLRYSTPHTDLVSQTILRGHNLEIGKEYTIDNLIFRMIAYSDNESTFLLQKYLKNFSPEGDLLKETYIELGMITLQGNIETEALSPKTYASFFRLLYNASYLSKELSDRGLEYLASSDFKLGLRGGIPNNVVIAHKFGERRISDDMVQLHDCGIIYFPDNPYMLCVMTKGHDFDTLSSVIKNISKSVWDEVNSRKI